MQTGGIDSNLFLENSTVALEPLGERHLPDLRAHCNDAALWEHTFQGNPFTSDEDARAWLTSANADSATVAFAIRDVASAMVIGSTRYLDIQPAYRKLEIGWTFIARAQWRTRVNTACKLLLLHHAFDEWKAVRVQLKAEADNQRSRTAMLRLGLTYEGTLRNFRIRPRDGKLCDVAFFSAIAAEWPALQTHLIALSR